MSSKRLLAVIVMATLVAVGATLVVAQEQAPTDKQLLDEAEKLVRVQKYEAAMKRLEQVRRDALGFFDKGKYDSLLDKATKGVEGQAAAQKALAEGKEALTQQRFATAVARLSEAAASDYLTDENGSTAKGLLGVAEDGHRKALADVKILLDRAKQAVSDGRTDEAARLVAEIKAKDVKLGMFERGALADLEKKLPAAAPAEAPVVEAPVAEAPVEEPVVEVPAQPPIIVEAPTERPIEKPAEEPIVAVPPEKPAEEPIVAVPPEKPAEEPIVAVPPEEPPAAPPVAAIQETWEKLSLAEQAKRAEASNLAKLGRMALENREYEEARRHFREALRLWPESEAARKGYDEVQRLVGEREEPVLDQFWRQREMERERIIAQVHELVAEAARRKARAVRAEDYAEALYPLGEADRVIDLARVLAPEEAERLREEVLALRRQIVAIQVETKRQQQIRAVQEAKTAEEDRIRIDQQERERMKKQLWERAAELRRSTRFPEAIQVIDRLLDIEPDSERAHLWRDDLLYLEAADRQVKIRYDRRVGAVEALTDVEEASIHPGEKIHGESKFLRYPPAKVWKELSEYRLEVSKAVEAEPKPVAETRRRLQEKIDLDFQRTSLDNVLRYISEVQRGLNIVVDPDLEAAGIDLSTRVVDLKLRQVSVESVLALILGADLGYRVEAGYILITTRDKLQQRLPVVTYPVQDLVARIPDFGGQAPRFEVGDITQAAGGAGAGAGFELFGEAAAEEEVGIGWQELVDILQRSVNQMTDPNVAAWTDEGGPATVDYLNGLLIITQTPQGHERVMDLLDKLRRERAIMISVEARFIQVTDDFLQDITIDADVAMNPNSRRWNTQGNTVQNPAADQAYNTLPGIATLPVVQPFGQPIIVSSTGSNGMGTATLLPLTGTAFSAFTANEGGLLVSGVFLDDVQVGFLLRAIQADVRSQTLFAPRITLFNGQRAYISVSTVETYIADAEPVVAEAAVAWDPVIGSIPVGATLDVKATVSADRRYVQMDLRPQVAQLTGERFRQVPVSAVVPGALPATTLIDLPIVALQDLKTTASVPDGGTLLLGGSKQFIETEAETGVPVLSKIPVLRRLFNNRASLRRGVNLLILIKPKIIIQAEEEARLGVEIAGVGGGF